MATIVEEIQIGFEHHQAGRLDDAERMYRQALESSPRHAGAAHLLGLLAFQRGQHEAAARLIREAIDLDRDEPSFYSNLGEVCRVLNRMAEAEAAYRGAVRLLPTQPDLYVTLGSCIQSQGRLDEAIVCYEQALAIQPANAEALYNWGTALAAQGHPDLAADKYRQAIGVRSDFVSAWYNLGRVRQELEQWNEAAEAYRGAIAVDPKMVLAHNNLGNVYQQQEKFAEAIDCYRAALRINPNHVEAWQNLGMTHLRRGDYQEGDIALSRLLTLSPNNVEGWHARGRCLQLQGRFAEAIEAYDRALALEPAHSAALYHRASARLIDGDFARGWPELEHFVAMQQASSPHTQPIWQGEQLQGERIVIHSQWGLGDTLQFVRYVPRVREMGGEVVLAVQRGLIPLLEKSGFGPVVPLDCELPDCRWQVAILSLPRIVGTSIDTIPAGVPYLAADPDLVALWRERLRPYSGPRIGIHWHGSNVWAMDERSMPLAEFEPLARIDGVTLVSLQKNQGAEQISSTGGAFQVVDFGDELDASGAFLDTAAIMKNLDLVVTCDTATAHLAGALGLRVWIALPWACEWRWLWNRDDSPWYPTARLFRQSRPGDWSGVFARMAQALRRQVQAG